VSKWKIWFRRALYFMPITTRSAICRLAPLIAHNAGFDFGFLNNELTLIGRETISMDRMVDTVAMARKRHPGAKLSLDALCSRYGIDRSHRVKHGALLDAELLAQVYVELKGGRQIGLSLASEAAAEAEKAGRGDKPRVPENLIRKADPANRREPRPHAASEAELAQHAAFLEKIKDPLWSA
jgi:DNA polymerase-3 subunit epsilon